MTIGQPLGMPEETMGLIPFSYTQTNFHLHQFGAPSCLSYQHQYPLFSPSPMIRLRWLCVWKHTIKHTIKHGVGGELTLLEHQRTLVSYKVGREILTTMLRYQSSWCGVVWGTCGSCHGGAWYRVRWCKIILAHDDNNIASERLTDFKGSDKGPENRDNKS